MPKFRVTVEKKESFVGSVEVTAKSAVRAQTEVNNKINLGKIRTTDIQWGDGQYEDFSFGTTGDVDKV